MPRLNGADVVVCTVGPKFYANLYFELGMSLMLNKPLIIVATNGFEVLDRVRLLVEKVITVQGDIQDPAVREAGKRQLTEYMNERGYQRYRLQ